MSVFGTILDKLGFKKRPAQTTPKTEPASDKPIPRTVPAAPSQPAQSRPAPTTTTAKPPQPAQSRPAPQAPAAKPPQGVAQPRDSRPAPSMPPVRPTTPTAAQTEEIPMVDVVSKLDKLAAANPQELNWRRSIVDLLKLLDMDSSLEARKELATELGIPADTMADNVSMNVWLHKTVLQKLAENGGNVPKELLD